MATVLIDLDGTLIPLNAWRPVFAELCEEIAREAGVRPEDVWRRARQRNLEQMRALDWRAFDWQRIFTEVARELGLSRAPDVGEALQRHLHAFTLNEGAAEALARLREMGHRVEIATNGHAVYQLPVIRRLGLDRLVDGVRTSDMYQCPKTCPQYFENADAIVGDNPIFDVYFPRRFGLITVFYGEWERSSAVHGQRMAIDLTETVPHAVVKALREVPDAVERLLPRRSTARSL
ncbi:HAD family hydrolase [Pyrobaculum neutrophilum]|uniref:Haloacid dehalogenase domain protein hydrolase n=1 Tax=Pyrobaculum neutrophilum (strain DSM 2338 / JCM 9278 / NBRC 100436 / V24Sta) TaxID=444157 RepID=B1YD26_PYRNV|nr:HAD family hydrolase [Pyrobaculum neutrophilum]ACB39689.1 Haloacid dehalogenase domain protein hydrolase [Pyrobaculum neutrophilum V24Sta]